MMQKIKSSVNTVVKSRYSAMSRMLVASVVAVGLAAGALADPSQSSVITLDALTRDITVVGSATLTGTLNGEHKVSIADDAFVFLRNVTIHGGENLDPKHRDSWAGLTCLGTGAVLEHELDPSGMTVISETPTTKRFFRLRVNLAE